jgi:HPt (histidine-containing phosphotransfer) domain-containing protein
MHTPATTPPAVDLASSLAAPVPLTLDSAAAIALMDNSVELYQEIAHAYLREIADLAQRLEALLQKPQLEEATRALHTAKGLSATVGANRLSDVCRQCELQLKSLCKDQRVLDEATRQAMKTPLDQAIAATQQALQAFLAQRDAQAQHVVTHALSDVDMAALIADLRRLRDLLSRSDGKALDWHSTLFARHRPVQEQLRVLNRAIKTFDFAQAVVQCDELIINFSSPITR